MSWITFMLAVELAYLPMGDVLMWQSQSHSRTELGGMYYSLFEAEAEVAGLLFFGGSVRTSMAYAGRSFDVDRVGWMVAAGARPAEWLEIGWRHYCTHPVIAYMPKQIDLEPRWELWYEELYARVELKMGVK